MQYVNVCIGRLEHADLVKVKQCVCLCLDISSVLMNLLWGTEQSP